MNLWAAALLLTLCCPPCRADSFPSWSAKARKARARGDGAAELQAWSNALRLWKPSNGKKAKARAYAARAALREKAGDREKALRDLSASLRLDGKDAATFHSRGRLLLDLGRASEAVSDFYRAAALKPSLGPVVFDRGRAYETLGDLQFAREDFKTACRLGVKAACKRPARAPEKKSAESARGQAGESGRRSVSYVEIQSRQPTLDPSQAADPEEDAAPAPRPLDFKACIRRMDACAEKGHSFGTCVARARLCGDDPEKGCCPPKCVELFRRLANQFSEAQAFRDTFRPGSACVAP